MTKQECSDEIGRIVKSCGGYKKCNQLAIIKAICEHFDHEELMQYLVGEVAEEIAGQSGNA